MSKRNLILIGILILGIAIRIFYLSYTPPEVRGYDVAGHLERIEKTINGEWWPAPWSCWQCHHPPLYYLLATPFYEKDNLKIIQWLSLFFFTVFLLFGLLTIRRLVKETNWRILAALVLVFWPSGIIHSVRVSNDPLFYALYAVSFFFLVKSWQEKKFWPLALAFLFGDLAALTKLNGLVILGLVVLFSIPYLFNLLKEKKLKLVVAVTCLYLLAALTGGISVYKPIIKPIISRESTAKLANLPDDGLRVGNQLANLTWIDLPVFLSASNIQSYSDEGGRQYLANYLLKTSLFGEFKIENPVSQQVALTASWFLIWVIVFNFIGLAVVWRQKGFDRDFKFLTITAVALIAALVTYRVVYPYACNQDFRYIFPILLSLAPLQALVGKKLLAGDYALGVTFILTLLGILVSGVIFIVLLSF